VLSLGRHQCTCDWANGLVMQPNQTFDVSMMVRGTPSLSHISVSLVSGVFRIVPGGDRWDSATFTHHVYEELVVASNLNWAKDDWVQLKGVVGPGLQKARCTFGSARVHHELSGSTTWSLRRSNNGGEGRSSQCASA
jgi:hypothetical protein